MSQESGILHSKIKSGSQIAKYPMWSGNPVYYEQKEKKEKEKKTYQFM